MNKDLEVMALEFEKAAKELELAAKHCLVAADHYRNGEVPRGCAHAFAAIGHNSSASKILMERAQFHATKARPE